MIVYYEAYRIKKINKKISNNAGVKFKTLKILLEY